MVYKKLADESAMADMPYHLDAMADFEGWTKQERDGLIHRAKKAARDFTGGDLTAIADVQLTVAEQAAELRFNVPKVTGHHCFADRRISRSECA